MRDVLDRMRRAGRPPLHTLSVGDAREAYRAGAEILDLPRAALERVEDLQLPARDGCRMPARLYAPSRARLPVLLYLHGGGFTIGNLDTHDSLCRQLALQGDAAVLSLDYRLAPEHRFPAAVDDAWDALQWLAREGSAALGLDATRLAIGGDSAGGTLSAVCALLARDARLPLALQLLFYPGTAARQDSDSHRRFAEGVLLARPLIDWFFGHYIPPGQREDWRFAPLLAPDHAGVAPAWIGLAECDPLVDEGIAYGDVLRAAGVPVQLELWRGVVHDFIKMGRVVPEARIAHAAAGRALKEAFSP
ncbi:alpha/beta hydrolase [Methylibium sp.]|uniref:alpha/beta hydrolase n=1 Tax=Methylibium sp. TaxID=2067992 RepID=UPI003D0DA2F9